MALMCGCDSDGESYVEFSDLYASVAGVICSECKKLVIGNRYDVIKYSVIDEENDDEGEEYSESGRRPVCEECGDLAMSFLELGYCWARGQLRNQIKELYEMNKESRKNNNG